MSEDGSALDYLCYDFVAHFLAEKVAIIIFPPSLIYVRVSRVLCIGISTQPLGTFVPIMKACKMRTM